MSAVPRHASRHVAAQSFIDMPEPEWGKLLSITALVIPMSMLPFAPPRELRLPAASVTATVGAVTAAGTVPITLRTNATALFVVLTSQAAGRFSDNSLLLEAGAATVDFISWEAGGVDSTQLALLRSTLRVEHLAENLA